MMKTKDKKLGVSIVIALMIITTIVAIFFVLNNKKNNEIYLTLYSPIDGYKKVVQVSKNQDINKNLINHKIDGYEFIGWFYDNDFKHEVKDDTRFKNSQILIAGYSKIIIKENNNFNVTESEILNSKFLTIKTINSELNNQDFKMLISDNLQYLNLKETNIKNNIIEDGLFYNKTNIKQIVLPDNIVSIGKKSFKNCYNLEKIENSDNLKTIDEEAFYNCSKLENINILNVEKIYKNAFYNCENLKKFEAGKNLKFLEDGVFNKSSFNKIIINNLNENFVTKENILYTIDYKTLITSTIDISNNIVINSNVENILECAFDGRKNLKSVVFSDNLKLIKEGAFEDCINLEKATFKENLNYVLEDKVFYNCYNLREVKFLNGLYRLENSVFENCLNLKSIEFNISTKESVFNLEYIGNKCFKNCKNLEYFVMPDSVESIGEEVFSDCLNLKNINLSSRLKNINKKTFFNNSNLNKIISTSSIEIIGDSAFEGCLKLVNINTINDAEVIGIKAFKNCESLINISFNNLKELKEQTFYNCLNLSEISLNSLEIIEKESFYGCKNIENFNINEIINFIDKTAFDDCVNLKSFNCLNSNYFSVVDGVLYDYDKTKIISYPQGKEDKEFKILKTINDINNNSFYKNKFIEKITVESDNGYFKSDNGILYNLDKTILYRYPINKNQNEVSLNNNLKIIKEKSFINNEKIEILTIPNSVEEIEKNSFLGLKNLKKLTIPFIGENRYDNKFLGYIFGADNYFLNDSFVCDTLKEIEVTNDLIVGEYCFYNLDKIEKITFNENVNKVESYAFYNNKNLKTINFLGILTDIKSKSFYNVSSLKSLTFNFYKNLKIEKNSFFGLKYTLEVFVLNNNQHIAHVDRSNLKDKFTNVYKNAEKWRWIF